MMRLDRFLANQGLGTRKETKQLIRSAAVRVNGVIIMKEGAQIKEDSDEVTVNGETIHYQKYLYLMMNKPAGTVCANEDSLHETVFDLLPSLPKGMFTAGRLDLDTTGLLLITNDGPLAHRLLSPRRHVVKWYAVTLDAPLDAQSAGSPAQRHRPGRLCKHAGADRQLRRKPDAAGHPRREVSSGQTNDEGSGS